MSNICGSFRPRCLRGEREAEAQGRDGLAAPVRGDLLQHDGLPHHPQDKQGSLFLVTRYMYMCMIIEFKELFP